jgi:hypothetical protein
MADIEVAEGAHIRSNEIKATNIKLFTHARDIVSLGEGLVAFAGNNNTNVRDGKEYKETFGYSPYSDTGRAISALGSNGESNQTQNAFLDITYKSLPSQIENKRGAEVHIQGQNGLSLKLTYQRAEDLKDEAIHIESYNGVVDVTDEKLIDSVQSISQVMTMMLKEQRAREKIQTRDAKKSPRSPAIVQSMLKPTQQQKNSEPTSLQKQRPFRIKQFFKKLNGPRQ